MQNPMKIAYLAASSQISGGQRVVFQQAEGLAERGHKVTLVCPEPPPTWFPIRKAQWETSSYSQSLAIRDAHIRVATYWTTVTHAMDSGHVPVFHLCQGYEADFSFNQPVKTAIETAYALPTIKMSVSPHVVKRLISLGHADTHFIGQTFNAHEFPPAVSRSFNRSLPFLLLPGIFEADVKGVREALKGLSLLCASDISFQLHRVSTWPQSLEERQSFSASSYHARVFPVEMAAMYRHADLLIHPSHPAEGFGLHVLEALSSGLPVLLSDTPGHKHIAGYAAEYFECGDPRALFQKLKELLSNRPRLKELSKLGLVAALRFRTENVVNKLIKLFSRSLDATAPD